MSDTTLSDVARAAGVSPSTVSRILNGTAVVAEDKRVRVLKAIKHLSYRPNVMAQGLARGQSMSIGVLTQAISSPFYAEALMGIEEGLDKTGYHPIFVSAHWNSGEERQSLEMLIARRVDAIIMTGSTVPDKELLALATRIPLVIVGRTVPKLKNHCINIDNIRTARLGVQHLLDLGHRRIAYISGLGTTQYDAQDRFEAYRATLENAGVPFDPSLVVDGDYTERSGLFAMETLFSRGSLFTALACANDQMAYGARLALYRRNIRIPEEMSLVGFDDLQSSAFTTPPLTSVRQPILEMGRLAAKMVVDLLLGQEAQVPEIRAELVVRESSAMLRGSRLGR